MTPVVSNPLHGIALHAVGATAASLCYTPQKKVRGWTWQSYWIIQAAFCWIILPVIGALLTIPQLREVLSEAPPDAMWKAFSLGAAYGIGGTAFGIAIRYLGFSITYAISIGISCVLGTVAGPLISGKLGEIVAKPGGSTVLAGVAIGALGIGLCGLAGRCKEMDLKAGAAAGEFQLARGLVLCFIAGILSAVYGFSLAAGQPIADVAARHGAGEFQGNVIYIFSNSGAFLTTGLYCLYLHLKHRSLGEIIELPAGEEQASLPVNWMMAILTGCLWYCQFFFYGLAHTRMGNFKFSSWAIHMILLVLISSAVGVALKEWKACKTRTHLALALAVAVLVTAVLTLTWGNYLGDQAAKQAATASAH